MGFLPFVNQGGQRIVRWHRLFSGHFLAERHDAEK
jgi:hypothetical protein